MPQVVNGNNLTVDGGSLVNGLIAADIAYAIAHPSSYSASLLPGADGQAFGSGQGFSPGVPEPSTWTMLIAGFAGVGYAAFRRAGSARSRRLPDARSKPSSQKR